MIGKYRKKPVIVEAIQWTGDNTSEVMEFCNKASRLMDGKKLYALIIKTLEGDMKCERDDWIIKGINGEFYSCKPDVFEKTYERAK